MFRQEMRKFTSTIGEIQAHKDVSIEFFSQNGNRCFVVHSISLLHQLNRSCNFLRKNNNVYRLIFDIIRISFVDDGRIDSVRYPMLQLHAEHELEFEIFFSFCRVWCDCFKFRFEFCQIVVFASSAFELFTVFKESLD